MKNKFLTLGDPKQSGLNRPRKDDLQRINKVELVYELTCSDEYSNEEGIIKHKALCFGGDKFVYPINYLRHNPEWFDVLDAHLSKTIENDPNFVELIDDWCISSIRVYGDHYWRGKHKINDDNADDWADFLQVVSYANSKPKHA